MSEIIKLSCAFKDYLWGGTKLKTEFNKKCDLEKVAESWELSTHKDGQSLILGGDYDGMPLQGYINTDKEGILGKKAASFDFFPMLIKLIDAHDNLSVQVHPDDEYALKNEGEYGKTEMWYIVDCEEGAFLYFGLNEEISKDEFEKRIADNTVTEVLKKVPVKKGDFFFIKAGTIHAIGKGILICEIQQNSNTTYRVYDYDRRDKNNNPRELHIKKALEVSSLKPAEIKNNTVEVEKKGYKITHLGGCKYFSSDKIDVNGDALLKVDDDTFHSFVILDGNGTVVCDNEESEFVKGDSIFVTAGTEEIKINGKCSLIMSYVE